MKYDKNNHFKFGYDDNNDYVFRERVDQQYTVEFGRCSRAPKSFLEECINVACLIKQEANNNEILLSLSGGIDSEFIAYVFLKAKIPFTAIINQYKNELNEHDIYYAKKFCIQHEIKYRIFEMDVIKFLENDLLDWTLPLKSGTHQFAPLCYFWDNMDGFLVDGNADLNISREPGTKNFFLNNRETCETVHRYFVWRNREGTNCFYLYNPEIMLSFLLEDEIMKLFLFGHNSRVSTIKGPKEMLFRRLFPMMEKREIYSGFEKIKHLDNGYRKKLLELTPGADGCFITPIEKLIDNLWPLELTQESGGKYLLI